MSRIRTIKPEFFKHEGLFDAEAETGLPLRIAFIGLWTQCDREGRFVWRPRQLKADIFPYDDVDFSRVLDALSTRGFVVRYASEDKTFGCIPSWHRHQVINNRETASSIPGPIDFIDEPDASATRRPRVPHATLQSQSGREGKGKEEPLSETSSDAPEKPPRKKRVPYPPDFEAVWTAYPTDANMSKSDAFAAWKKLDAADKDALAASIPAFVTYCRAHPDYRPKHMVGYIKSRRFDGHVQAATITVDETAWRSRLKFARERHTWSTAEWGPRPGLEGCLAPKQLLEPGDGDGWREWEKAA